MRSIILTSTLCVLIGLFGCERKPDSSTPAAPKGGGSAATKEAHSDDDGHDHDKEAHGDHKEQELGSVTIAGFAVRAVLGGEVVAGKEVDVDVHVTGSEGKVNAVRLWIGTEDGKDAMKMKATINKDEAHNHVEVPSPLPAGAKLCIELELTGGEKKVGSLALKP
ncbi:MAG: hypothetical protein ACKVS9_03145 [Phycisphaerae bacterium]